MTRTPVICRMAAILTAVLLMHIGAMAVDPAGMHGSAHAAPSHSGHAHHADGQEPPGTQPTVDMGVSIDALVCLDGAGVPSQTRVSMESLAFTAVLPPLDGWRAAATDPPPVWVPPVPGAGELRVFLQVFLN